MPQNQKTEPVDEGDVLELPELTSQQQKFVEGIVAGKTATDAYRAAYDCSDSQPETVWANASRLRANAKVVAWIQAAQFACLGSATLTLNQHMQQLERLRELALGSGNIGAAVLAEHHRGKAAGHYVDQIRDVTKDHDPVATLNEIAREVGDEAALKLARENNIPWSPPMPENRTLQ